MIVRQVYVEKEKTTQSVILPRTVVGSEGWDWSGGWGGGKILSIWFVRAKIQNLAALASDLTILLGTRPSPWVPGEEGSGARALPPSEAQLLDEADSCIYSLP